MKRALKIFAVVASILALAWIGLRFYLHSAGITNEVAKQLEAAYGGPVKFARVDIGLTSTTISGLQFFEPSDEANQGTPWLSVESVTANVRLWQLARGDLTPTKVHVQGAKVLLRFDESGTLLTRLPPQPVNKEPIPWDRIPQVTIDETELILRKTGQGDLAARDITARVTNQAGQLTLTGSAQSDFGPLDLSAAVEERSSLATATVVTRSSARVTGDILDRLPFVPPVIFRELRIGHADATGTLTASYDLNKKEMHFLVDVNAKNATVSLPSAGVVIQDGAGKVVVDDETAHLRAFTGHTLGGTVSTEGDLDFAAPAMTIRLPSIKLANVNVNEAPESWSIPAAVRKSFTGGKLFGTAKLELTFADDVAIAKSAAAQVANLAPHLTPAPWLDQAALGAVLPLDQLGIKSQGNGQVRDPAGRNEPVEFDWNLAPATRRIAHGKHHFDGAGVAGLLTTTLIVLEDEAQPEPQYLDLKFNLKNASLAEIVKNEDLKLPFPVDGKISFAVKASIPLGRLDDLKAYKAEGSAHVNPLNLAGLKFDELTTDFQFADGVLYFKSLKSDLIDNAGVKGAAGQLTGSGRIQLAPLGDFQADLNLQKLSLQKLAAAQAKLDGSISGSFCIYGNAAKLPDTKALEGDGKIASDRLTIYGLTADQFASSVKLKGGVLTFPDLQARVDGELVEPTLSLALGDEQAFVARVTLHDRDSDVIRKIAAKRDLPIPKVSGTIDAEAVVKIKSDPFEALVSGDVRAKSLKVENVEAQDIQVKWNLAGNKLSMTDVTASVYDGKVTGSALVATDGKEPGQLNLQVHAVELKRLARDLRMPVAMSGRVDGTLKGTLSTDVKNQESKAVFHVDFKAPKLRVQNIPTEQLHGVVNYQRGAIDYNLTGKTLGGTFDLEGEIPPESKPAKKNEKVKEGRLRIKNIHVGRLMDALGASTEGLRGKFELDLRFKHDAPNRFPQGKGTARLSDLRWGDEVVTENLQADVVLTNQQIRVRDLSGDLAQGTATGEFGLYLREPERSWFTLNLDAVELGRLLPPSLGKKIEGSIQARLRGKLGKVWTGTAEIEMGRGKVSGLEIADWRIPAIWSYSRTQGRGELEVRETSAQVARGRANGKVKVSWENAARVEGLVTLDRVELGELLRETIGKSSLGAGRTTAKFEFKGTDVRSANDLTATLAASFEDTQAFQVPVLQPIAPFLGVGPSTTFQKGVLAARLERGTARISRLTLQGNNVQVYMDGSVTLAEQLNLHVVAKTGDIGWPTVRLGPIGLRVPITGPVPLVLVQEVSTLISNHTVYLDVTGTPGSPVIRPRPLPILSEEAVRFFLNRSNLPVSLNP